MPDVMSETQTITALDPNHICTAKPTPQGTQSICPDSADLNRQRLSGGKQSPSSQAGRSAMQCGDKPDPTSNFQGSPALFANIPPASPPVSLHCTPTPALLCPSEITSFPFMTTYLFLHFAFLQPSTSPGSYSSSRP